MSLVLMLTPLAAQYKPAERVGEIGDYIQRDAVEAHGLPRVAAVWHWRGCGRNWSAIMRALERAT